MCYPSSQASGDRLSEKGRNGRVPRPGRRMQERLAEVIETVYAGVGESGDWAGILESVAGLTGAASGCIVASHPEDPRGNVDCFHNIDGAWIKAYNDHFYQFDPSPALMQARPGQTLPDHVTGPRPPDLTGPSRAFYNEVMVPQDFRHTLALGLAGNDDWNAGIILQRTPRQGEFDANAITALERVAPHLRQGLQLHARLAQVGSLQAGMAAALDRGPTGVVFLDTRSRTVFLNRRAEELLEQTGALRVGTGGIAACHAGDHRALQALIQDALAAARGRGAQGGGGVWLRDGDRQSVLHARVTPVSLSDAGVPFASFNAFAAVWLSPRETVTTPSPRTLCELYQLSAAEGELLARLAAGATAAEIARGRGVTLETVRSQLKTLMNKLGVSRQVELVRLVLAGPGALGPGE